MNSISPQKSFQQRKYKASFSKKQEAVPNTCFARKSLKSPENDAYLWIDHDTGHIIYCDEPENHKVEVNALGGYAILSGTRYQIKRLYRRLLKRPYLLDRIIKI